MKYSQQMTESRGKNSYSLTPLFGLVLAVIILIGLGPISECSALTVNPTTLTFEAVQGAANPPDQTLSVYRKRTNQTSLTNSENASWITVSPTATPMTTTAQITVAVNTSGLAAGTYDTTITIKIGTKATRTVPVTLTVSPPPSATATARLAWDPVSDTTLAGYKIYIGTASGLYTRTITVGNLTSHTVDSLNTRTTYYFAVTAYNSAGESAPSNEVSKSIY